MRVYVKVLPQGEIVDRGPEPEEKKSRGALDCAPSNTADYFVTMLYPDEH